MADGKRYPTPADLEEILSGHTASKIETHERTARKVGTYKGIDIIEDPWMDSGMVAISAEELVTVDASKVDWTQLQKEMDEAITEAINSSREAGPGFKGFFTTWDLDNGSKIETVSMNKESPLEKIERRLKRLTAVVD